MNKKIIIFILLLLGIIFYNTDFIQEKLNQKGFYQKKITTIENEIKKMDKSIKVEFEILKKFEANAQNDFNDYVMIYTESEKNLNSGEIRKKAKEQVEKLILAIHDALQKTIDKRNTKNNELNYFKSKLQLIETN
jgi:uncharacterized protein (UPF0248 family)